MNSNARGLSKDEYTPMLEKMVYLYNNVGIDKLSLAINEGRFDSYTEEKWDKFSAFMRTFGSMSGLLERLLEYDFESNG